ncbi:type VII secretion protein EccB [Streptomyces flaveolus]|uniref:Type VII secretion protein EccB n=1 Tax=Streptomyces flaveolus TaxID=67297 RepID=A0ABV1VMC6_9ACTN
MQNRKDQVQAHQFVVARLTAGLLRADPDAPETPLRRTNRGVIFGAILGVVISLGFLAYGFIRPGGATAWQDGRTLVIEKGTGNRYLYDGRLRPVRNYASARLILGPQMSTTTVASASLEGTTHGAAAGIEGAPDDLPRESAMGGQPWEVCVGGETAASGTRHIVTSLLVAADQQGSPVAGNEGVVVGYRDDTYLIWKGTRFKFTGGTSAMDALGYTAVAPLPVSDAFLDALPAGADLEPPPVAHLGSDGPVLDGVRSVVGQVFFVRTPGVSQQRYYLVEDTGLVPVTTTQAALALVRPDARDKAYGGRVPSALPLSTDALSRAPSSQDRSVIAAAASMPPSPPALRQPDAAHELCARIAPQGAKGTTVGLLTVDSADLRSKTQAPTQAMVPACVPVDAIYVPPNGGSLVRALSGSGIDPGAGSTIYLVTDTGVKYRIADSDSALALGYRLTAAQAVPMPLMDMLPTGPDLSTAAAEAGVGVVTDRSRCGSASAH